MDTNFGDYIIYADESGDHSLTKIDKGYPIFCLALCAIKKEDYINKIVPAIQKLKFDYWGHDKIILHEREIRKEQDDFAFLRINRKVRESFYDRLSKIIADSPFYIFTSIIDKEKLQNKYETPFNPYDIALQFCMERLLSFLVSKQQKNKIIHCIFESRGNNEDKDLENAFYKIIANHKDRNFRGKIFKDIDFHIKFAKKSSNFTGLQLADLVARPVGVNYLRHNGKNRAYNIIKGKYYRKNSHKTFP